MYIYIIHVLYVYINMNGTSSPKSPQVLFETPGFTPSPGHGGHVELPKHRDAPLHVDDAQLLRSRHDDRGSDPDPRGGTAGTLGKKVGMLVLSRWFLFWFYGIFQLMNI